jgi:hypothetical protein
LAPQSTSVERTGGGSFGTARPTFKMPVADWKFHTPRPVPPVQPDDIENALAVILPIRWQHPGPEIGICTTLYAERCDASSNIAAVGAACHGGRSFPPGRNVGQMAARRRSSPQKSL